MVSSEDFSFPKINYPPNFAISSPSLWRVSSLVYPEEVDVSRRSFSCSENNMEDEKMDMLWEDFNEELQRVVSNSNNNSSMEKKKKKKNKKEVVKFSSCQSHSSEKMVELCCAQALQMSRTGSGMIYHEKRHSSGSMVVVMKVLKKIFLLKNSIRIKKNQPLVSV